MCIKLLGKCHEAAFAYQNCELIFWKYQHVRCFSVELRTFAHSSGLEPQQRENLFKLPTQCDIVFVEKAQFEVFAVCLKSLRHWNGISICVVGKVISLERNAIYIVTFDAANSARPCDIARNAELFPFRVAGLEALLSK